MAQSSLALGATVGSKLAGRVPADWPRFGFTAVAVLVALTLPWQVTDQVGAVSVLAVTRSMISAATWLAARATSGDTPPSRRKRPASLA